MPYFVLRSNTAVCKEIEIISGGLNDRVIMLSVVTYNTVIVTGEMDDVGLVDQQLHADGDIVREFDSRKTAALKCFEFSNDVACSRMMSMRFTLFTHIC